MFDRRRFIGMAAALALPQRAFAQDPTASRWATIDWAILETMLALGVPPLAAAELRQYTRMVIEPPVPPTVVDLGLRGSPNYELLQRLAPDHILISSFYEYQRAQLERIAPVLSLPFYEPGVPPFSLIETSTQRLGDALGVPDKAMAYLAQTRDELAARKARLTRSDIKKFYVINLGDARHFRAFGQDSLLGDVLPRLGLVNAWSAQTSYSAAAPVALEALAEVADAGVIVVSPLPPDTDRGLARNAIWKALPAVRSGRVAVIEPVNHFGGLPSARRFARLVTEAALRLQAT